MSAQTYEELAIAKVRPAEDNLRSSVGDVAELAQSIKTAGLLEPLIVTRQNGGYTVVAGHRRLAAAKKAGLKSVPAIVREFSEQERQEAMLIENLQRHDLSVLEEAEAYRRLVEDVGLSQHELAKRVGRNQSHISKRLQLLLLPEKARKAVDAGSITVEEALDLAKLAEHPKRLERAMRHAGSYSMRYAIEQELSHVRAEERVAEAKKTAKARGLEVVGVVAAPWDQPRGQAIRISKAGDWHTLNLDPVKHAKEPCHAVVVDKSTGKLAPVCTDRTRHREAKTTNESRNVGIGGSIAAPRDSTYEKHHQALAEAETARKAFLAGVVSAAGKLPKADLTELVLNALVNDMLENGWLDTDEYMPILGFSDPDDPNLPEADPLAQLAAKGGIDLLRAGLVVALAMRETSLSHYGTWAGQASHFEFLEKHGYKPSKAERDMLAGKAPR